MNKKERITSQKKIILKYLKLTKSHPTAAEIYRVVKKNLPQISYSTVYRILDNLKDKGEIIEILDKKSLHYDGDLKPHIHFFCQRCNKIYDIYKDLDLKFKTSVGKIKEYKIYCYGTCQNCLKNNLKRRSVCKRH